jgi:CheY-like chemotaxis protein
MQRGDGYELVRGLRGRGRHTPVIALTALATGEQRERALREGFDAVVSKGTDPELIVRTIARLAESHRARARA